MLGKLNDNDDDDKTESLCTIVVIIIWKHFHGIEEKGNKGWSCHMGLLEEPTTIRELRL